MPQTEKASCAVVVPVYTDRVTDDEMHAIRHLKRYLGGLDILVVAPEGLRVPELPCEYKDFPRSSFSSRDSYSKLLLSREFYQTFTNYDYILIYQLDCLVFSSDIEHWTGMGYDYIGAPLFNHLNDYSKGFSRVGNGGFSLRRVQAFLDVIDSDRYDGESPSMVAEFTRTELKDLRQRSPLQRFKKKLKVLNAARMGSEEYRKHYSLNEDLFWSDRATLFLPSFNIAPVSVGLAFAFEQYPEYCFAQNDNKLPFGCHAWAKWGREFWSRYLLD